MKPKKIYLLTYELERNNEYSQNEFKTKKQMNEFIRTYLSKDYKITIEILL